MAEFDAAPKSFDDSRRRYERMSPEDVIARAVAQDALLRLLMQRQIEAEQRQVEAEKDSLHDDLTGIANRRSLRKAYDERRTIVSRRRTDPPVASDIMLLIDLDDFKSINDIHGHTVGDEALKTVAHLLDLSVRAGDRVGRLGGDEFLGLLNGASVSDGKEVAERMRKHAQTYSEADTEIIVPTFSIGVAEIDYELGFDAMLDNADKALYGAKRAGKDKVYVLEPATIHLP